MAYIFMMMVAGLLLRVIAILGVQAVDKIDRHLTHEKPEEAPLFQMKITHGKHIIKESLLTAQG